MSAPKRIYLNNQIYFITTKIYQNIEYFKESIFCDLLIENLRICKRLKRFELYAFCLLYEHLHLLLKPNGKYNISNIMFSLKKQFSHDVNRVMGFNEKYPNMGEQTNVGGKTNVGEQTFVRLQLFVQTLHRKFVHKYGYNQSTTPMFKWQKSFYDHIIRSENDFYNHYRYTAYNFQKHNLPKNWKYTSLYFPDLVNDKL